MKPNTFSFPNKNKKENAQGFVEFALAIPILLVILFGLLEVGRLLFIYSSVVTAARQAVRYGAVTGLSDYGYPRYQDCRGIRDAAKHVGFISEFEDSAIDIAFDAGPGTSAFASCDGIEHLTVEPETGDRLLVSVSTTFEPIVPLVPLEPMTIESSSSRTIVVDIAIDATLSFGPTNTPTSTPTNTPTPTFTPTVTDTPTNTPTNTPTPVYSPTASNTPTNTATSTVTYTPTKTFTPTATGTATYTPSPTSTPIECYVSHNGISITQNKILLTIHNDSAHPITISDITIFYNASSPSGQKLTGVNADTTIIWSGLLVGSPITLSEFDLNDPIAPGVSLPLKFFFSKNLKVNGTENIMVSFVENGCDVEVSQ